MALSHNILAALAAAAFAMPAFAGDISVEDAYARAASPSAMAGAAFMIIRNDGEADDRLVAASSDIAKRVELHTHVDAGNGVMQMREVEDGFPIPAQGQHMLMRGGDHVMFMGLNESLEHGESVQVTLTFEKAGEMTVDIPVDLERMAGEGMGHGGN